MKPAAFKYHDPRTLADLTDLLGRLENTKILAGGQSLGPMLNYRYVMPDHIIDLNRISELSFLRARKGRVEIGAMTRQRALERSAEMKTHCPIMVDALRWVGHFQTRNRGTIGGSLSHLDPAAELPGICALYDATMTVIGSAGEREIPMSEWGQGYMSPNLEPDEVLTGVELETWTEPHGWAFLEFSRRHGDFAMAGAACLIALDKNGAIARAALSLIGVNWIPARLTTVERMLVGEVPGEELLKAAAAQAIEIESIEDAHASSAYRSHLAGVLTRRVLHVAAQRAMEEGHA